MSRAVIGVSESLHSDLKKLAKTAGIPITVMLAHWHDNCSEQDWEQVKADYNKVKPTWKNIKKNVQEYQKQYPEADDKRLSELTGYSIAQVETITHTAHKRTLAYMKRSPQSKPERISKECSVSVRFATRLYDVVKGEKQPTKAEAYLFEEKK